MVARALLSLGLASSLAACAGAQAPAAPLPVAPSDAGAVAVEASVDRVAASAPDAGSASSVATDAGAEGAIATSLALAGPPGRVESAASLSTLDLGIPRAGPTQFAVVVNVDAIRATSGSTVLASVAATSSMLRDFVNSDLHVAWALVDGPSLDSMDKNVAVLRCDADDGTIDAWLDAFSARTRGSGPVPLSLPDTYAVSGELEGARVAMRLPHHLLALVPADLADDAAHALAGALLPDRVDPREALRLREKRAPRQSFPEFVAPGVSEMRVWFEPGPGGTVDAFVEEETKAAAAPAAEAMRTWVRQQGATSQMMATGGLFDHVDVTARGRMATAHLHASREQVVSTLGLMAKLTGASRP
jgi:hypothetical protein